VREYKIGDEPRRIHWRSTARLGKPMVREQEGQRSSVVVLVLDRRHDTWNTSAKFSNDNSGLNFETAVETFASILNFNLRIGHTVFVDWLDGTSSTFDPTSRSNAKRRLANVTMCDQFTIARKFSSLRALNYIVVTHGSEPVRRFSQMFPGCSFEAPKLQQ